MDVLDTAMGRTSPDFQIFAKPASYRCNLQCSYCYYLEKKSFFKPGVPPLMADDLLEEYIRQHIRAHPGKTVNFSWHGGEPTLLGVDYFRRIVSLQQQYCPPHKHITNGIQTNGTLLNDEWGSFLAEHRFSVGLSLDGPGDIHDVYRSTRQGKGTHAAVMRGYKCLREHGVPVDVLCVVNDYNVMYPLQVYRFFTSIGAKYLSFLPLVEPLEAGAGQEVSDRTVHPEAFGAFLCTIFDEWLAADIGAIKIQIFEEVLRTAFEQEHSLCLFRPTCGDIPVIEYSGDVYACDHFVNHDGWMGNVRQAELGDILCSESLRTFGEAKRKTLPRKCRSCDVLAMCNGECPKNRFVSVEGEAEKLNYLCPGYTLFFTHCRPFVDAVSRQWRHDSSGSETGVKTGRNEPCPCGSGQKYKKCCLKR